MRCVKLGTGDYRTKSSIDPNQVLRVRLVTEEGKPNPEACIATDGTPQLGLTMKVVHRGRVMPPDTKMHTRGHLSIAGWATLRPIWRVLTGWNIRLAHEAGIIRRPVASGGSQRQFRGLRTALRQPSRARAA
jgi:hypothetical protein